MTENEEKKEEKTANLLLRRVRLCDTIGHNIETAATCRILYIETGCDDVCHKLPNIISMEANALPEIYLKVAEAKRLMETGEVATINAATPAGGDQPQCLL